KPHQNRFFGDAQDKANVRQPDFDQEHLQGHHHLVFRGPQVKENGITCLSKAVITFVAIKDTSFSALGHIGRKVSGIVAANMAKSIKEGTYKGAGCFYLDEIVNVADFMSGLKHHELFSIKTGTNL
ncbi:hypothetical protein, partial [Desulfobacter sp.]|uniref:hypothetical protein n=1 Tax=Desulfobacter sp. TaxID=2294 RepID=UPI003D135423